MTLGASPSSSISRIPPLYDSILYRFFLLGESMVLWNTDIQAFR